MSYGRGTITEVQRKRGPGYRVKVPDGQGGEKSIGTFDTLEEAEAMRDAANIVRAELPVGVTLREYGETYLGRHSSKASAGDDRSRWHAIVMDAPFADCPLALLTRSEVRDWARALPGSKAKRSVLEHGTRRTIETGRTRSRQTALHALGLLRRCIGEAVEDGHLEANVAEGVRIPKDAQLEDPEVSYLGEDEVRTLLGSARLSLEQRVVFTLAVFAGLRQGELAGLDWDDVDLDRGVLHVRRSWDTATKNRRRRIVPLLPAARRALEAWPRGEGRVFGPYARGYDWGWADQVDRANGICRLGAWRIAGITRRLVFHDLRDTCATHLLSGTWGRSWTMQEVSALLGHSSIGVTERRYARFIPSALERAAAETPDRNPTRPLEPDRAKAAESLALPEGFEPSAFGLGSRAEGSDSASLAQDGRVSVGSRAERLLRAVADGKMPPEGDVEALALAVLDGELVQLALRVLQGGPHQLDRAIELAEQLRGEGAVRGRLGAEQEKAR